MLEQFLHDLTDPPHMVGHINYALLIISMMMRKMFWLRVFAIGSGSVEVIYRSVFVVDPVSVVWEAIFVLVNVVQLIILWYDERHHDFRDDERHFVESMPTGIERQALKRLLALAQPLRIGTGEALIREGQPVESVLYIADGVAQISSADRLIAICRPGDYLGEMSFLTGSAASATVTAVSPIRALAFDQRRLHQAIEADVSIRRAMEAGLNRNLVGKLVRANAEKLSEAPPHAAI
ncbi:MAG: cyclic nucleotide-binding domain-containing protein [Devosia sp.]|nr:cyclic nucleotide-binding domain-containing protein [Devosia sp.]